MYWWRVFTVKASITFTKDSLVSWITLRVEFHRNPSAYYRLRMSPTSFWVFSGTFCWCWWFLHINHIIDHIKSAKRKSSGGNWVSVSVQLHWVNTLTVFTFVFLLFVLGRGRGGDMLRRFSTDFSFPEGQILTPLAGSPDAPKPSVKNYVDSWCSHSCMGLPRTVGIKLEAQKHSSKTWL